MQSTVTTGILSPALPGAGQYPKGVSWGQKPGAVCLVKLAHVIMEGSRGVQFVWEGGDTLG